MLNKIKNKYILKEIFNNIRNKRKLKILKHNKALMSQINITKKDFEEYQSLKKFNQEFNINLDDTDIEELNLKQKISLRNLQYLSLVEFKNLKILNLTFNGISYFNVLGRANFQNLQELNLGDNRIKNIHALTKLNFPLLEKLNLESNLIVNINLLGKVNFPKLKILNFQYNLIEDINVLE